MTFLEALQNAARGRRSVVIPDVKCVSPKDGDLMRGRDPLDVARTLVAAGAPVLSCVTEPHDFGGSRELLTRLSTLGVPVLRKDFLATPDDMVETKRLGASAVLLMYSCLQPDKLATLYHAAREVGLDVLVECHTAADMRHARTLGARLMGVNNRDITVLERDDGDVSNTQSLASLKPDGALLISESSLKDGDDVRAAIASGADAALVGTSILQADDTASFYRRLCRRTSVKLCGMMSAENIAICADADILGFVVDYPERVPWDVQTVDRAAELMKQVPHGCKTCVVTGGSVDKVVAIADALRPDFMQLHYRESLADTVAMTEALAKRGIAVIRTVPLSADKRSEQFGIADAGELARVLADAGVSMLLVDGRSADNAANAHAATPLDAYRAISAASPIPVMLAGGITADNVAEVLDLSGARYIDIMTGIETSPGVKSRDAVNKLFASIGGQHD